MNTEWNKAVRRVIQLPYKTHTKFLPHLVNGKSFKVQHASRVLKFVDAFMTSKNTHVYFIGQLARYTSAGALGRNYTRCILLPNFQDVQDCGDTDTLTAVKSILEFVNAQDNILELPVYDKNDIELCIDDLCCN